MQRPDTLPQQLRAVMQRLERHGVAQASDADVDSWFQLGDGYFRRGDFTEALRVFTLLAIVRPKNPRILSAVGLSHQELGQHAKAAQYFGVAQLADLDDPEPTFQFARCLAAMGSPVEAKAAFDIVIEQTQGVAAHASLRARACLMRDALNLQDKENA